ncbi:MAG: hypothetical protein QM783_05895 [Phycisphaerales bacterium]
MSLRFIVAAIVCVLLFARGVLAQENILPLPLEKLSITEAAAKAKREHRVLIVIRDWKRPPEMRRPWWANDSVRAWMMWHAVMVKLDRNDEAAGAYLKANPPDKGTAFFGFDMFIDGGRVNYARFLPEAVGSGPNAAGPDDWEPAIGHLPTATMALFAFDLQMDFAKAKSPAWAMSHEKDCPAPARPARMYYFGKEADGLPTVPDVRDPKVGDLYVDVLARLREADRLIAAGDKRQAFAMLTWLWERGPEADPAFAFCRVGLVLPRMAALADKDEALATRLTQIAEAELALYPWYDDSDEVAYLALRYHEERREQIIKRVIVEGDDTDEQTMAGIVGGRLGDLKAYITERTKDKVIETRDWQLIARETRRVMPPTIERESREWWRRQTPELVAVAGIRTYAALLSSESAVDRARAESMGDTIALAAAKADPPQRAAILRALAFAAASVGRAGPVHAAWIRDAQGFVQPPAPADSGKDAKPLPTLADPLMRYVGVGVGGEQQK